MSDTVKHLELIRRCNSHQRYSLFVFSFPLLLQESWGGSTESDTEEFKRMLQETNPWLLALTVVVSILHSVFDFLAFRYVGRS